MQNFTEIQALLLGDPGGNEGKGKCPGLTCRLVRPREDFEEIGMASGFIVQRSGSLFLLSAGHALRKEGWCLETDAGFEDSHETLLIPLNDVLTFASVELPTLEPTPLEFAFARLDIEKLNAQARDMNQRLPEESIEFKAYVGPLDEEPVLGKADYSYASWHSTELARLLEAPLMSDRWCFEHTAAYEFGMTYMGRTPDGRLYRFALAGSHKGDDYYRGGSGAPIVDRTGKVVSLLVGADDCHRDVLTGLPLKDYARFLDPGIWSSATKR